MIQPPFEGAPPFTGSEIKALSRDYDIYPHTQTHSHCLIDGGPVSTCDLGELRRSKLTVEKEIGRDAPYMAWSFGAYNDAMIAAATKTGFTGLFTVEGAGAKDDRLRVDGYGVSGLCGLKDFSDDLRGHFHWCSARP